MMLTIAVRKDKYQQIAKELAGLEPSEAGRTQEIRIKKEKTPKKYGKKA